MAETIHETFTKLPLQQREFLLQSRYAHDKIRSRNNKKEVLCVGFDYGFEYALPDVISGAAAGMIAGIFLIIYFLAVAFSVISYVLGAVGMYRIAKRRGIYHKWLAWIPIGNSWLLGCISDHYQYIVKQNTPSWAKSCLTGRPLPLWSRRSQKTMNCPTTPCLPPTPCA